MLNNLLIRADRNPPASSHKKIDCDHCGELFPAPEGWDAYDCVLVFCPTCSKTEHGIAGRTGMEGSGC